MRRIMTACCVMVLALPLTGCGSSGGSSGAIPVEQEEAEFETVMQENRQQGGGQPES